MMQHVLPNLTQVEQQQSQALFAKLTMQIEQAGGQISFAEFMQTVLYDPTYGYYTSATQKFGEAGDFVTAPEISPLFAMCLAKQCQDVLSQIKQASVLEFGAGTGQLALHLLQQLKHDNSLPLRYYILEVSPDCRQRQQALLRQQLPDYFANIIWLDHLPSEPFNGVVIANEVIDAMPVHLVEWHEQIIHEVMVTINEGQLRECLSPPSSARLKHAASDVLSSLSNVGLQKPYRTEINIMAEDWLSSLAACLGQAVVLILDYGFNANEYYHPDRTMGTLMCHYRHRAHADPFLHLGLQDITAHVDFSHLAIAAQNHGLDVAGFTQQASFLLNCGLLEHLQHSDAVDKLSLNQQVQLLTSPAEMGELIKVLALTKQYDHGLLAFNRYDKRDRL